MQRNSISDAFFGGGIGCIIATLSYLLFGWYRAAAVTVALAIVFFLVSFKLWKP